MDEVNILVGTNYTQNCALPTEKTITNNINEVTAHMNLQPLINNKGLKIYYSQYMTLFVTTLGSYISTCLGSLSLPEVIPECMQE